MSPHSLGLLPLQILQPKLRRAMVPSCGWMVWRPAGSPKGGHCSMLMVIWASWETSPCPLAPTTSPSVGWCLGPATVWTLFHLWVSLSRASQATQVSISYNVHWA